MIGTRKSRVRTALASLAALLAFSFVPNSSLAWAQTTAPKIAANLVLTPANVHRGRSVHVAVVVDIPAGYHVNAHVPRSRYALPTKIEVVAPAGIKIGSVVYPRGVTRRLGFSREPLAVYERRVVIGARLSIPAGLQVGSGLVTVRLTYQSCSDEVCFPPVTRELTARLAIN